MSNLKSKSSRNKLPVRRESHWSRICKGLYIGYRRLNEVEGTWIARRQTEDGRRDYRSLRTIIDIGRGRAYDLAVKQASEWMNSLEYGVTNKVVTVETLCKQYIEDRRLRKSSFTAKDAEDRFKRLIYGNKIGRIAIDKLMTNHHENMGQ